MKIICTKEEYEKLKRAFDYLDFFFRRYKKESTAQRCVNTICDCFLFGEKEIKDDKSGI